MGLSGDVENFHWGFFFELASMDQVRGDETKT